MIYDFLKIIPFILQENVLTFLIDKINFGVIFYDILNVINLLIIS